MTMHLSCRATEIWGDKDFGITTLYLLGLLWGILSSINFLIAIILFTISKSFGLFSGHDPKTAAIFYSISIAIHAISILLYGIYSSSFLLLLI